MKALLMSGGKGTRLHPFTATFPKPLMPLGDMPIIEILLRQLKAAGVEDVVLAVNHLHHLIRAFCGDGSQFGMRIAYSVEESPLGTAGPIGQVLDDLGDTFLVMNGDLLTTFDVRAFVAAHQASKSAASIAVFERSLKLDFGVLEVDADMHLSRYLEKPTTTHLLSMGLYVLEREAVARHVTPGMRLDMPELMQLLIGAGRTVNCVRQDCHWLDIGRPEDYAVAQQMFESQRSIFLKA